MENSMEVPQKPENRITIWPNNPTPGHELRENHNSKRYMHPNVHYSTIYNSQDMEATYMSVNRGMDKDICGDICNGILLCFKKEWNSAICRDVDEPRDCHIEWSNSEKRVSQINTCMWNLEKMVQTYLQSRNNGTDRRREEKGTTEDEMAGWHHWLNGHEFG